MRSSTRLFAGGALMSLLFGLSVSPSWADREEWEAERDKAQREGAALEEQIAGLDESLKEVYRSLNDVREKLPTARGELAAAEADNAAAQRNLQQVSDRLELTQAELKRIRDKVEESSSTAEKFGEDIAGLARELYRSGDTGSPLMLALTSETTSDISDRTATAQAMARAQSQALENAREALAVERNQSARQEALTQRVTQLRDEAVRTQAIAADKASLASSKLADLEKLEATEAARATRAEASRQEARAQLEAVSAQEAEARRNIARIDEENRRRQNSYQNSASAPDSGSSGGSSSGGGSSGSGSGVSTSGIWAYPLPSWYPITSPFGYRYHPIYGEYILHSGTDIGAPCGTPALATANGVVTEVSYNPWGGNYVTVNYGLVGGNSYQAMYLHLSAQTVYVGQSVTTGQTVGLVGTTGSSTGCHLHYEFLVNGESVDAMAYM